MKKKRAQDIKPCLQGKFGKLDLIGSIHMREERPTDRYYYVDTDISGEARCRVSKLVQRSKTIATFLSGRPCIYKDKFYIGPVVVDSANCSNRWIRLVARTLPWKADARTMWISMRMPANLHHTATGFEICVSSGMGMFGQFIYHPQAIQELERFRNSGASFQDVIWAMNAGLGLPEPVRALRKQRPFDDE